MIQLKSEETTLCYNFMNLDRSMKYIIDVFAGSINDHRWLTQNQAGDISPRSSNILKCSKNMDFSGAQTKIKLHIKKVDPMSAHALMTRVN